MSELTTKDVTKTEPAVKAKATPAKKRKPAVKREFNVLGKFFAILRIELSMTTDNWAKDLGVSPLAVANVERGDKTMSYEFAKKVTDLVAEKAPKYSGELAAFVAEQLGVVFIPKQASGEAVEQAFLTLYHYDAQIKNATAQEAQHTSL